MTDYDQINLHEQFDMSEPSHRFRDSIRVVVELLAVATIGWLASTVTTQNTSLALLAYEVKELQMSITSSIPDIQKEEGDHEKRITRLEDGSAAAKRWTR